MFILYALVVRTSHTHFIAGHSCSGDSEPWKPVHQHLMLVDKEAIHDKEAIYDKEAIHDFDDLKEVVEPGKTIIPKTLP